MTNYTYVPMGNTFVPIIDDEYTDEELELESLEESLPEEPLQTNWFDLAKEICYPEVLR
jgi:hypothetical protein